MSKELNRILDTLDKEFGKKNVWSKGPRYEEAKGIPTGCEEFDLATGIGGWPTNRISEICAPPSSGKTSWVLYIARKWKETFKEDSRPIFILDLERSISSSLLTGLGHDPDDIYFSYPDSSEEALNTLLRVVETGSAGFVIIDAVDGLVPEKILNGDIGDATMGLLAKQLAETLRRLSKAVVEKNVTVVFLNHLKQSLSPYAPPKTTPGGVGIPYYSSFRVELGRAKESTEVEGSFVLRPKIIKNKCAAPNVVDCEFNFMYGKGPDPIMNLIGICKKLGILKFQGSSVKVRLDPAADLESYLSGGKKALYEKLSADASEANRFRELTKIWPVPEAD
jgi:recombination protein RecA